MMRTGMHGDDYQQSHVFGYLSAVGAGRERSSLAAHSGLGGRSPSSDTTPSVTYSYDQTSFNGLTISNGNGLRTG
jgi:hypothetical protein